MKRSDARRRAGLVIVFFFSGVAGLGYQVVWAKQFGSGIGHEYPATLAVITAFMTGMALGGCGFEQLPDRWRRTPWAYAALELLIGVWGALSVLLIPALNRGVIHLLGTEPPFLWHWAVVFAAVFLGILPATVGMGATLPALEPIVHSIAQRGVTGLLYAANTAGAMLGALAGAFWTMRQFGLSGSLFLFAGLNLACGVASLVLAGSTLPTAIPIIPRRSITSAERGLATQLLAAGLLGIAFETLIIRGLNHLLENTIYTFACVLAVYLFGAALGAGLYQRRFRTKRFSADWLFAGLAVACFGAGLAFYFLPAGYTGIRAKLGDSLLAVALSEGITASVVFLVPAALMGAVFSGLAERSLNVHRSLGWSVGWNSLGAAAAPPIFGLVVIPLAGLRGALGLVVVGYALLARGVGWWLVLAAVAGIAVLPGDRRLVAHPDQEIAFFREGLMGSVAVLQNTNGTRVLKVNNRFQMGGTAARSAEARQADIPLLLHPEPRRALFIGLGTGITLAAAARYPGLAIDGVELLPEVVEAMPLFQEDPNVFKKPSLAIHIADGRRYILATTNRYDVIVGDLYHPAQDGAGFLYTREHFAAVRARLSPNGLFCQWLPVFQMDLSTVELIGHTFRRVFPHSEMWLLRFNVDTPVVGLIGWIQPPRFGPELVEQHAAGSADLRDHLRALGLADTLRLLGSRLGPLDSAGAPGSAVGFSGNEVNTDNDPAVIFRAPAITFQRQDDPGSRLLRLVEAFPVSSLDQDVADEGLATKLRAYAAARNVYLAGLTREAAGEVAAAVELYVKSARVSPEFTSGYAQAIGLATAVARQNPKEAEVILRALMDAQPQRPVARELLERLNSR